MPTNPFSRSAPAGGDAMDEAAEVAAALYDADGNRIDAAEPSAELSDVDESYDNMAGLGLDVIRTVEASDVPSFQDAAYSSGLPIPANAEQLSTMGELLIGAWKGAQARLPETGEITSGYFAIVRDIGTGHVWSVFFGGVAICRVLGRMQTPFRARLEKSGRTWVFR